MLTLQRRVGDAAWVLGVGALLLGCGDSGAAGTSTGGSSSAGSGNGGSGNGGSGGSGDAGAGGSGHAGSGNAGSGNAGSANGGSAGGAAACDGEAEHQGEGTYYAADGSGNCSFDASPNDLMVGAMNQADYQASGACGRCAAVVGPSGAVTVRIVDRCPECAPGDIDLSPQAFEKIAALELGRVAIDWRYVPCQSSGPIAYFFKQGSNQWWTAVQVRNHRHGIAKFEYDSGGGSFVEVARENYNYFVEPAGMGPGPYTFRVTDVYGHQLIDSGVVFAEASQVSGADQFPACE